MRCPPSSGGEDGAWALSFGHVVGAHHGEVDVGEDGRGEEGNGAAKVRSWRRFLTKKSTMMDAAATLRTSQRGVSLGTGPRLEAG